MSAELEAILGDIEMRAAVMTYHDGVPMVRAGVGGTHPKVPRQMAPIFMFRGEDCMLSAICDAEEAIRYVILDEGVDTEEYIDRLDCWRVMLARVLADMTDLSFRLSQYERAND
jgi:hypothetical protein